MNHSYIHVFQGAINSFILQNSVCHDNHASSFGGCLSIGNNGYVTLHDSTIHHNEADHGGGVHVTNSVKMRYIGNNVIEHNSATVVGGAMAILNSNITFLWVASGHLLLFKNRADRGSAMYLYRSVFYAGAKHGDINVTSNHASVAGTVYWIHDGSMLSPDVSSIVFKDNSAPYGSIVASQAVRIEGPSSHRIVSYGKGDSISLQFRAFDYHNNTVVGIQGSFSFSAAVVPHRYNCSTRTPSISG